MPFASPIWYLLFFLAPDLNFYTIEIRLTFKFSLFRYKHLAESNRDTIHAVAQIKKKKRNKKSSLTERNWTILA